MAGNPFLPHVMFSRDGGFNLNPLRHVTVHVVPRGISDLAHHIEPSVGGRGWSQVLTRFKHSNIIYHNYNHFKLLHYIQF